MTQEIFTEQFTRKVTYKYFTAKATRPYDPFDRRGNDCESIWRTLDARLRASIENEGLDYSKYNPTRSYTSDDIKYEQVYLLTVKIKVWEE
jgi:hypothetical protein